MFCPLEECEFIELGLPLLMIGTWGFACYHHVKKRKLADGAVGTTVL